MCLFPGETRSNEALEHFLDVLSSMEQLDFLRIGTRTPVT